MKIVMAWLVSFGLAIVVAASCSIDHRSDAFACEKQSDCMDNRVCTDGFCVSTTVPDDGKKIDGAKPDIDAPEGRCPPQCTACNEETMECTINCETADCTAQVVCPAGWNCDIKCNRQNACRNGINCLQAASCAIDCSGDSSCRNVACGTGRCNVACSGNQSCRSVSCGQSCGCDVKCDPTASCDTIICSSFQCETLDGCSSQNVGCDICP